MELLGGASIALPGAARIYPVFSASGGVFFWEDQQPYDSHAGLVLALDADLRVRAFSWAEVSLGARAQRISQRVSGGMRLDADRGTYAGVVAGLVVPLWR